MTFDLRDRNTLFASLPKGGIGVEVGVDNGGFSAVILRFSLPNLLYLVDCWEHQPEAVCGSDPGNQPQPIKDDLYQKVLEKFLLHPAVRIVKAYSVSAALTFPDEYFDWVFLDANHLRCAEDIVAWWPKIKRGGYLMGHDYCTLGDFIRVKTDVDEFVSATNLPLLVTEDPIYKCWIVRKP